MLEAAALVLRAGGPVAHGTCAEAVRLHDDKVRAAARKFKT